MANINLNISPYFDDFDPTKDYLRVLYRPGFPVQARELTTLQSFMQEQIERFGNHIFKDGSRVTSAEMSVDNNIERLFLTGSGNVTFPLSGARSSAVLSTLQILEGKIISSADGAIKARVVKQPANTPTANVGNLYVQYITQAKFDSEGGYIYVNAADNTGLTVDYVNTYSEKSSATIANVAEGIFYVQGFFTRVAKQTVLLSSSSSTPSLHVGFRTEQTFVTQNDDSTLFDNARGSSNEGAPGAHRLKQNLVFSTLELTTNSDPDFYRVLTVEDGVIKEFVKANPEYQELGRTLARRTYDESGNYALKPFSCSIGVSDSEHSFRMTIGTSKAYVEGYEVEKTSSTKLDFGRGLDVQTTGNFKFPFLGSTSLQITGAIAGNIPGQVGANDPYTYANRLQLKDSDGDVVGIARAYGIFDGRMHIYDIKMFQVITYSADPAYNDGADFISGDTFGYVYNADGQAGHAASLTVINSNGRFIPGRDFKSTVSTATGAINNVHSYSIDDVVTIDGTGGFSVSVVEGSVTNVNPRFVVPSSRHIKTMRGTATVLDNDLEIIDYTGAASGTGNGDWNVQRVDDQEEAGKQIRFKYLKIQNPGTGARATVNFGWTAQDKQISLHFSDVHKVYKVNNSSNTSFANGRFTRLTIDTAGIIPQGSIITGKVSGSKAIVALSNTTVIGAGFHSNTAGYHEYESGTGSNSVLEVIFQKGTSFTIDEEFTVLTPDTTSFFTNTSFYRGVTNATGKDITGLYLADSGQRDEYYDVARLVRKDGKKAPSSGDVVVFFSYFDANPVNNHIYTVDSYRDLNFFAEDVRYFNEPQPIAPIVDDSGIDLRNVADFRFRLSPPATPSIADSPFLFTNRQFYNQARVVPNSTFTTDIVEYLGRIDSVILMSSGSTIIQRGVSNLTPSKPVKPDFGMPLFYLNIPPAVRYPEVEVDVEKIDNRRFTMKDIGKLENRIQNLETAVSLSLLESQALHDDVEGRTKMGFVVDDFSQAEGNANSAADENHPEFNASYDLVDQTLIPAQTDGSQIPMTTKSSTRLDPFFLTKEIAIKAYVQDPFLTQTKSTGVCLINPFATWVYEGDLNLTPEEHHWRDRVNNYFTRLFGNLQPFAGDSDAFSNFLRVDTRSPGGSSTSRLEWFGNQRTTSRRTGGGTRVTRTQARRRVTTTTFDPRPIAGSAPTETLAGSEVIENPQSHWMRNPDGGIAFDASNLRPNTLHKMQMGGVDIPGFTSISSDAAGVISGRFDIPPQTFRAGTELVTLADASGGNNSYASKIFTSIGHRDTFNISVGTATNRTDIVNLGNQTRSTTFVADPDDGGGGNDNGDPIAQSFRLPLERAATANDILAGSEGNTINNSILTSIDLWFSFVDERVPFNKVKVEIRKMINGYPGGPSEIIGSTGFVTIGASNAVVTPSESNASNFRFLKPVRLSADTEYAIVIKCPSDSTSVYCAEVGQQLLDGNGIHDTQPNVGGHFGSLFKSQNQTTWTANQNTDLAFKLYRADFGTTQVDSTLVRANSVSNTGIYRGDIGAYSEGLSFETYLNSNYVKVIHPNHGLNFDGAQTQIFGIENETLNGIPGTELNTSHIVKFATLNSYFIKAATTTASSTGVAPTPIFSTFASQSKMYDSLLTNFRVDKIEGDEVVMDLTTHEGNSVVHEVNDFKIVNTDAKAPVVNLPNRYEINSYVEFETPKVIRDRLNSTTEDLTQTLTLKSGTRYSSPFFKIDDSTYPVVFRNIVGSLLTDSEIEGLTTVAAVASDDDIQQEYASREAALESQFEMSNYVTSQIDLEFPADGFTVRFDADMEPSSRVEIAYKARAKGDSATFDQISWTEFPRKQQIAEFNYGPFSSAAEFNEYVARVELPFEFSSFKVRLRFVTLNEAQIPRIKDLRIIADL